MTPKLPLHSLLCHINMASPRPQRLPPNASTHQCNPAFRWLSSASADLGVTKGRLFCCCLSANVMGTVECFGWQRDQRFLEHREAPTVRTSPSDSPSPPGSTVLSHRFLKVRHQQPLYLMGNPRGHKGFKGWFYSPNPHCLRQPIKI